MNSILNFLILVVSFLPYSTAYAEDRALLIGVGEYKNNIKNLPGVLLDVETMKDSAKILGFEEKNIKLLLNDEATLENVQKTIKIWLIDGTKADDKVLIYFSGHGSRIPDLNGDENDGADEVLVLYDSIVTKINNKKTLKNVLLDDDFSTYLQQIKSHDLMLLVDACNSGTVYRGFSPKDKGVSGKFFNYLGIPQSKALDSTDSFITKNYQLIDKTQRPVSKYKNLANRPIIEKPLGSRFIAITAAGDDELALATKQGSIFTEALHHYLKQAAINHQQLTPNQLTDKIRYYIEDKVQKYNLGAVYQPQLAGNTVLANKAISFIDSPKAKINWNRLQKLDVSTTKLAISASKKKLLLGESITLNITIPREGYLNIITIGPDDKVFILYPNPWEPKNHLKQGILTLPTKKMDFEITLTEPVGKNLMLAILTKDPINLYLQSNQGRDRFGQMFSSLNTLANKVLEKIAQPQNKNSNNDKTYLSGQIVVEVE